jgi:hypothetical protein
MVIPPPSADSAGVNRSPKHFPHMIATPPANPLKLEIAAASLPAHPLYPVDQVFLWLPGFPGKERPYCTYNAAQGISVASGTQLYQAERLHDGNGAFYVPRFAINPGTYICWHLHTSPPVPFHGVPVTRSLSAAEMDKLAQRVLLTSGENPAMYPDPLVLLRNEWKSFILASLSRMGLLSGGIPNT